MINPDETIVDPPYDSKELEKRRDAWWAAAQRFMMLQLALAEAEDDVRATYERLRSAAEHCMEALPPEVREAFEEDPSVASYNVIIRAMQARE